MKKIASLHLRNFKAFRDQTFDFGGNNVLLYGNNGSGKSSLYWALYTFLQSSTKTNVRLAEYFQPFDATNPATFQSLRNVFAGPGEESFIDLTWQDADQCRTTQRISATLCNTNLRSNTVIREADLASDFINYKLLQRFYDGTHKHAINLWDVFMRDIFPFFDENFETKIPEINRISTVLGKSYRDVIENILLELPRKENKRAVWNSPERGQYESRITDLNQKLDLFINRVQQNANQFLRDNFYSGQERLEIILTYPVAGQITVTKVKAKEDKNLPPDLRINLSVRVWDEARQRWIANHRPHSFLNEALLTRIALAVRIGALLDRLQTTDFKLLVLDDLLMSLDMSNRKQVLEWLFTSNAMSRYQLIILTHDRAFYEMTKHHIEHRQPTRPWQYYELYLDTYHGQTQPRVVVTNGDYLELARKHFSEYEFPACANYLRKACERAIKTFLPPNHCYSITNAGELNPKNLDSLIAALAELHREYGQDFTALSDLKLYKDLLLNPLSHDNLGTTVHQHELYTLLTEIVPRLQKLTSRIHLALYDDKPTFVTLTETDNLGVVWRYKIQLFENWRAFTFADGGEVFSKPKCIVIDCTPDGGSTEQLGKKGKCDHLQDAYRKIRYKLGVNDQPAKQLTDIVSLA